MGLQYWQEDAQDSAHMKATTTHKVHDHSTRIGVVNSFTREGF